MFRACFSGITAYQQRFGFVDAISSRERDPCQFLQFAQATAAPFNLVTLPPPARPPACLFAREFMKLSAKQAATLSPSPPLSREPLCKNLLETEEQTYEYACARARVFVCKAQTTRVHIRENVRTNIWQDDNSLIRYAVRGTAAIAEITLAHGRKTEASGEFIGTNLMVEQPDCARSFISCEYQL